MRVQDLQLFLSQFTKGSDAVKNAVIYVEIKESYMLSDEWKCTKTQFQS